jgi:hypothetical protein
VNEVKVTAVFIDNSLDIGGPDAVPSMEIILQAHAVPCAGQHLTA